jgi:hypothetical protein
MGRRYRHWDRWAHHKSARDDKDFASKDSGARLEEFADGVLESVDRIAEGFSAANDPVERERRRQEKMERRRRQEAAGRRSLFAAGAGLLAGGLAASSGLITVAAVGVGLLAGATLAYGLRWWEEAQERPIGGRDRPRPALHDPTVVGQDPRAALVRSVVTGAMGHLRAIDKWAGASQDLEIAAILTRIAAIGHRVCTAVAAQPALFERAQRLLTYHAEKAAKLAELSSSAEGARLAGVRRVLARMELLFEETQAALKQEDARELDLELKLIDQALDEDLRR